MRAVAAIASRMPPRTIAFLVFAIVTGAICVRLGFWQLNRLEMRRASNAMIAGRTLLPAVPVSQLPRDTAQARFRRTVVAGRPDYAAEIVLTHRGHNGAPGVDIITPIRVAGSDTAVLVNRGWAYAADGMSIDLSRWHEGDTVFSGYVDTFEPPTADSLRGRQTRRMSYAAIARALPYPIQPFYVVALADSARPDTASTRPAIVRLEPPKLGEGPHMSYAIQWFAFAIIAAVGASLVTARSMQSRGGTTRDRPHEPEPHRL